MMSTFCVRVCTRDRTICSLTVLKAAGLADVLMEGLWFYTELSEFSLISMLQKQNKAY